MYVDLKLLRQTYVCLRVCVLCVCVHTDEPYMFTVFVAIPYKGIYTYTPPVTTVSR